MPTIKGPIKIGRGMSDADRAKLSTHCGLSNRLAQLARKGIIKFGKPKVEVVEEVNNDFATLKDLTVKELKAMCKKLGIKGYSSLKEDEIIELILSNSEGV